MRVLHISNDYYNSRVYRTLHQGFAKDGLESVFFVPMSYSDNRHDDPNVVEAHCFHNWDRYLYMNKQRKIYREFRETVKKYKPDLVHGYFLYSGGIHCLWAKREFGIPFAVTVQNTDINAVYKWMPHLRGLARRILCEASAVFFVSAAYRDFVLEHVVKDSDKQSIAKKCRLLPFAVDPFWTENTDLSQHPSHDGPVRLLTVGAVNKSKNQLGVAEAVSLLRKRGMNAELTVIGAAEDEEIDRQVCAKPFVRRIPHMPKEELIKQYRSADIFVLPSFAESFGLVYAEALTQGVPVIYSAGQGFDHQFPEGEVGYRVDAHSPEDIAEGIDRLLHKYDDIQKNCAAAADCFSQSMICAQSKAFYKEVLM